MPLSRTVQQLFEQFSQQPLQTEQQLRQAVLGHMAATRVAGEADGMVDVQMGLEIGNGCLTLLEHWASYTEPEKRMVQAASLYFVHLDDDEDDFSSIIGFVDDAEVFNMVCEALGRLSLCVDV